MDFPANAWNESRLAADTATGRPVRVLITAAGVHTGPPYHGRGAFSADSRYSVVALRRGTTEALARVELANGNLQLLHQRPVAADALPDGAFALHEATGWIIARQGRALWALHLHNGEAYPLLPDIGEDRRLGCPAWTLSGDAVLVTHMPAANHTPGDEYRPAVYERIRFPGGEREVVWRDPVGANNHLQVCPADGDWLLIDRDLPPGYAWYGDYRVTTRAWLLHLPTTTLRELCPRNEWRFQMHTNFSADGQRIYYHGRACPEPGMKGTPDAVSGQYLGVCDLDGKVLHETAYPHFYYGHVGAHPRYQAIVNDGTVSADLLTMVHYEHPGAPIEILGRHDSSWSKTLGQCSHPHPVSSPDGRWMLFNRGVGDDRTEVCVLDLVDLA